MIRVLKALCQELRTAHMFLNYIIISRKFTRLKFDFQGVLLKSIERKPTSSNTLARESGKGRRERERIHVFLLWFLPHCHFNPIWFIPSSNFCVGERHGQIYSTTNIIVVNSLSRSILWILVLIVTTTTSSCRLGCIVPIMIISKLKKHIRLCWNLRHIENE